MSKKFQISQLDKELKSKLDESNEILIFDNREPVYLARKLSNIEKKVIKETYLLVVFVSIIFLCVALTLANAYIAVLNSDHPLPENWGEWGGFGGLFGGLNAMFSGCALAGIVYTMFLQRRAVELQQEEIKEIKTQLGINLQQYRDSREEYESSRIEYEQTIVLNSKSILLNAYNQQIQWHLEESRLRSLGKGTMDEKGFRVLTSNANAIGNKRWKIIEEMEQLARQLRKTN